MNKILIGIGALVVLLVAAVLVGPGLIDWNAYKAELSEQAERFTGRKLTIDGDLEISILPAPALVANDVYLANAAGATARDMVRLKSLQIRVALGPLLGGRIKVQTIHMIDPVIELELFADGSTNLEFGPADDDAGPQGENETPAVGSSPDGGAAISVDSFVVENATVVYRDAGTGGVETIDRLNATFAAASLDGPFESSGSLVARGIPLEYNVSVGRIIERRTAPISVTVSLQPGETKTTLSGAIIGLSETPKFKGLIKATGSSLSALVQSLGPNGALPGLTGQAFSLEGEVEASAAAVDVANMSISLGSAIARGTAAVQLGPTVAVNLDLGVDSIDLDKWLAMPAIEKAPDRPPESQQAAAKGGQPQTSVTLDMPEKPFRDTAPADAPGLPENIDAALNLVADSLTVNGGLVRNARLSADLSGGEITISQLSALLPGSSDVALFGFVTADEGAPRFEGEMEVSVGDLRGLMGWLGAPPPPVPSDRLRKLTFAAKLLADAGSLTADGIDIQFDSSRLTGRTVVRLGQRLGVDADLTLDRINLDAYLMAAAPPPAKKKAAETATGDRPDGENTAAGGLTPFAALNNFDASLKTRIKNLVYGGSQIIDLVLDASLNDGVVNVRRLSVDKMAGASLKASGQIRNLDGIPELGNILVDFKAQDVPRLLRMAGVEAPQLPKKMGPVSLAGKIDGSLLNPQVDLNLKGAGASIAAAGRMSFLPLVGGFDGRLKVVHGDVVRMLRSFGVDYRPGGKLGGLDIDSKVKADMSGLILNDLKVLLGSVSISGAARVSLSGPRTKISAALNTNTIIVNRFLPVSVGAFIVDPAAPLTAAFVGPAEPAFRRWIAVSTDRWPNDPIDLSVLKSFDADLKVRSKALVFGDYRLDGADIAASVNNGVLRLEKLNGGLFGGGVEAVATVRATSPPTVESTISLKNIDVAKALMAVTGESPAGGRAAMDMDIASSGDSVSGIIAALGGRGRVALKGLDVAGAGKGTAMSAALGLVAGLNDLGGALSGRKAGGGLADINGSFRIDKGVARSDDLTLNSSMGNGRARGSVDLSRWLIDVAGQIEMSQNVLGLILNQGQATPTVLPFSIRGDLDAPKVKLDTSGFQGAGLPIPGLDKVLKKKGIGNILQQIVPGLGGPAQSRPSPPPPSGNRPPPPPPPPPPSQQLQPQDLLKGLLKGLGG